MNDNLSQFDHLRRTLLERLKGQADPNTKAWWENYVKNSAPFLGVKMPTIRGLLHPWHGKFVKGQMETPEQVDLALSLFDEESTEVKLAGTLFLQEILIPAGALNPAQHLPHFADLFDEGKIYDWNTCDWFCVKVLGRLVQAQGLPWAIPIAKWRDAKNLWRARASLVAFVTVARDNAYHAEIEESCRVLIRRPERFAKTAVGWILRDISKHDADFVRQMLQEHLKDFSTESVRNATKYFPVDERDGYVKRLKGRK